MAEEWKPEHFKQGSYTLKDPSLDTAKRITVEVKVDGRRIINVQGREPGILAIVSKPDDDDISVVMVEAGGVRYVDTQNGIARTNQAERWALEALGLVPPAE